GRLVVAPDGEAVLVAAGLAPAPTGKTSQVWLVDDSGATSAGLFPGSGSVDAVALDGTVEDGTVVAVTLETAGGAPQPTSEPLLASSRV
ncbi:MAG: anti-sigma factor domain-containing protein, partial [Gaiella sp.]